ncbi:putative esterase [Halalkaliarchaeum sp. AArc-CO]|uniref:alpha/beta hydrolase n=1 Tax=unclassified Halalkaliarchaeum TaxID=2678344 RepID=UPI00217E26D6|nr:MULTISPECIES: dienelactone hydrolase family protein [unclassified Halalkaliarchaeum]MDR5671791.1 dienelactone hydrolase family protein [Halalkaliarchaeum sp. AArc-GB]UWG51287.1 putative esterase [Halalkaliarchaeum sp. AArc-CO]
MNHGDQPLLREGTELSAASAAVVLLHGRGASARSILGLTEEFDAEGVAYFAPQAAQRTWYPQSFLEPIERNEPWLSAALDRVGEVVSKAADRVSTERVALIGFSQGACLASEWTARNARRYGGLAALSGGLVGPDGTPRDYGGTLDGTPVFLGCSDVDPHIPVERVHETRDVFERLGGDVTESIYEGMGHGINADEIEHVSTMVKRLVG